MTLSQILYLRSRLIDVQKDQSHMDAWALHLAQVRSIVDHDTAMAPVNDILQQHLDQADQSITQVGLDIQRAIDQLDEYRSAMVDQHSRRSEQLYQTFLHHGAAALNRVGGSVLDYWPYLTVLTTDESDMISSRLHAYNNWQLPGLIIGPGPYSWIENLTGFDPLYILDLDLKLLQPAMHRFPSLYQQRLRPYVIDETGPTMIPNLPKAQFGLVLAYEFFNKKPIRVIQRYLNEILALLRPGGSLVMLFNDCDHYHSAKLFENGFACYTPGSVIDAMSRDIGYETHYEYCSSAGWKYVELKKAGELTTMRGGQSLAKIVPKR